MRRQLIRLSSSVALAATLAACGGTPTTTDSTGGAAPSPVTSPMAGMDHGSTAEHTATETSAAPFDAMFIDGMIMHHEGAISMAQEAQDQVERPEVQALAQQIIDAQEREIEQLREWRTQWYPDLPDTGGMQHMDMGPMHVSEDASKPFDQRFIEAMIPHHQSAVEMARQAQQQAEHAEIRELANQIIEDQEREIEQMQQWLQQWNGS